VRSRRRLAGVRSIFADPNDAATARCRAAAGGKNVLSRGMFASGLLPSWRDLSARLQPKMLALLVTCEREPLTSWTGQCVVHHANSMASRYFVHGPARQAQYAFERAGAPVAKRACGAKLEIDAVPSSPPFDLSSQI
jgi:hypothetical protein